MPRIVGKIKMFNIFIFERRKAESDDSHEVRYIGDYEMSRYVLLCITKIEHIDSRADNKRL